MAVVASCGHLHIPMYRQHSSGILRQQIVMLPAGSSLEHWLMHSATSVLKQLIVIGTANKTGDRIDE